MNFQDLSYQGQVLFLRRHATAALTQYPVQVQSMRLIAHGENTTFAVIDKRSHKFVLRIHRAGYHNEAAIKDELRFLQHLNSRSALEVQSPQIAHTGKPLVRTQVGEDRRFCSLLSWQEGRFVDKRIRPRHMELMGETLGQIHQATRTLKLPHRFLMNTDGLIGRTTVFGRVDRLEGVSSKDQKLINKAREQLYRLTKHYERSHPEEVGPVHGDLHFGNALFREGKAIPIDFDDSGTSFRMQDLAVVVYASAGVLAKGPKHESRACWNALLEGYARFQSFGPAERDILPILGIARNITMLSWLNARQDHPRLRKIFPKIVKRKIKILSELDRWVDPKKFYGS